LKELFQLFTAFMRIGGLTFGGGMAMLPMLQREVVQKYHWATDEELLDYFSVGQCTPGIIAINTATFVGYKRKKVIGALAATLGVIFPSLVIILVIAASLRNFSDNPSVQHAFAGIRVVLSALLVQAIVGLAKKGIKDWFGIILAVSVFLLVKIFDISTIIMVIAGITFGIAAKELARIQEKKGGAPK